MVYYFKNSNKPMPIKEFLKRQGLSSRTLTELSKTLGILTINDIVANMKTIIQKGQILKINYVEKENSKNIPIIEKPINIVYEDDYLLIVDKPINLPTIPSFSYNDSLAGRVQNYLGKGIYRAMNRLDADTTGLVIIAKDIITENLMRAKAKIKKYYLAIVEGKTKLFGKISAPIQDDTSLKRRVVNNNGLPAITFYRRLKYDKYDKTSTIECHLKYGRTNQIRCHLSYITHPLKYDIKYGSQFTGSTFFLRCYKLYFIHPYNHKKIKIKI